MCSFLRRDSEDYEDIFVIFLGQITAEENGILSQKNRKNKFFRRSKTKP